MIRLLCNPLYLVAMVTGSASNQRLEETVSAMKQEEGCALPRVSEQLRLETLWEMLGECLIELAKTPDHHAVLVLQPAVEAFFVVHAG